MTIIELVDECIAELGDIRFSVDEQESVAVPVRKVRDKQAALKNYFEQQAKKQEAEHHEEI